MQKCAMCEGNIRIDEAWLSKKINDVIVDEDGRWRIKLFNDIISEIGENNKHESWPCKSVSTPELTETPTTKGIVNFSATAK